MIQAEIQAAVFLARTDIDRDSAGTIQACYTGEPPTKFLVLGG